MVRTRTLYELFGVDSRATPKQIRTGYIRLLKMHHPDLSADPSTCTRLSSVVADLNIAFDTLSDPNKRADYDHRLAAERGAAGVADSNGQIRISPRSGQRAKSLGIMAASIAVILAIVMLVNTSGASFLRRNLAFDEGVGFADVAKDGGQDLFMVDERKIRQEVKAAIAVSIDQAVDISRQCFQDASKSDRSEDTAACIIFDNAVLIWASRSEDDGTVPIYFQTSRSRARDLDALARWDADHEALLVRLQAAPLKAMLTEIREAHPLDPPSSELIKQTQEGQLPLVFEQGSANSN